MTQQVITAFFDSRGDATKAIEELVKAGIPRAGAAHAEIADREIRHSRYRGTRGILAQRGLERLLQRFHCHRYRFGQSRPDRPDRKNAGNRWCFALANDRSVQAGSVSGRTWSKHRCRSR
jgi:hypothetical protein